MAFVVKPRAQISSCNARGAKGQKPFGAEYCVISAQMSFRVPGLPGDVDHLKVFANEDAAETWLQENDPEGVVFEYEVLE
jgi:hypothetical protein